LPGSCTLSPKISVRMPRPASSLSETTVRSWLARAGLHSQHLHQRFLPALHLTHVQLDELRRKLHGATEATWLWIACDAAPSTSPPLPSARAPRLSLINSCTKCLSVWPPIAFRSSPVMAGRSISRRALTAHFGAWVRAASERRRTWLVNAHSPLASMPSRQATLNYPPRPNARPVQGTNDSNPALSSRISVSMPPRAS
jgi:hypothetical protein